MSAKISNIVSVLLTAWIMWVSVSLNEIRVDVAKIQAQIVGRNNAAESSKKEGKSHEILARALFK